MTAWRTRRTLKSAIERLTPYGSQRPRLVCLCENLLVSLAFLIAVSLFPDAAGVESVRDLDVHVQGSIPPACSALSPESTHDMPWLMPQSPER